MLEFRSLGTVVSFQPGRYGLKRRASRLLLSSYRVTQRIQGGGVGLDAKYSIQSLIRARREASIGESLTSLARARWVH